MFVSSTERWTSLLISEAIAADSSWVTWSEPCLVATESTESLYRPRGPIPDPIPFVVGCKLADCGPGTDGPGPIDLRITLIGDLADRAILEFENMTVQDAARIRVRGNARNVKGTTKFEARSGIAVLRGLVTNPKIRPPVAIPHLTLNRKALEAFNQAAKDEELLASSKSPVTLVIEQLRGRVNVNRYAVHYSFKLCPQRVLNLPSPPPPISDRVTFSNGIPQNSVLVLAPGRVAEGALGCAEYDNGKAVYETSAISATVRLDNHLEDDKVLYTGGSLSGVPVSLHRCHSEIVVFGKSNALAVIQPVNPPWTDLEGDEVPVELRNPLEVPVTVWILYDEDDKAEQDVRDEIALATEAFSSRSDCGIQFYVSAIRKIGKDINFPTSHPPDYFRDLDVMDAVERLKNVASFYTTGTLNVYIVMAAGGDAGGTAEATNDLSCIIAPGEPGCDVFGDMMLIKFDMAKDTVLAHEIGHTLSLEHVGAPDFDQNNLMWQGNHVASRLNVTKGQCYRAHVDHSSYLNTDDVRTPGLPTLKECPRDARHDAKCPDLSYGPPK